jgi:hypothetical protein
MRWLFCPFADYSAEKVIANEITRYQMKYNLLNVGVVKLGENLAFIKPDDTLIIISHGLPEADKLSIKTQETKSGTGMFHGLQVTHTSREEISANYLAGLLSDQHLPENHVYVKTLTCFAAGMGYRADPSIYDNPDDILQLAKHNAANCFAAVLAMALGKRNYHRIRVQGYPGHVRDGLMKREIGLVVSDAVADDTYTLNLPGSGPTKFMSVKAKQLLRIWFDAQGKMYTGDKIAHKGLSLLLS